MKKLLINIFQEEVLLNIIGKDFPLNSFLKVIEYTLEEFLISQGIEIKDINIIFHTENEIQSLNNEFRKINKPTDVLSFEGEEILGEIYICPEYVKNTYKGDIIEELVRLTIHGVLHLIGYDHDKPFDEDTCNDEMFLIQEKLVKDILSKN